MTPNSTIETYLTELEAGLIRLAPQERDEIVAEIRAHLEARESEGRVQEGIAELGSARICAQRFRDELAIDAAIDDGRPTLTFGALLVLATKRILAAVGLLFAGLFACISIAMLVSVVAELVMPQSVGLWVADDGWAMAFGVVDGDTKLGRTEVLGFWYSPVAIALSIIAYVISQWIGRFFLKLMRNRERPLPRS